MENLYNYVYVTINKINGKCYVGSHASKFEKDNYLGSGNLIKFAVNKYGKLNFLKVKLKNYDTILEARLKESFYIDIFNTVTPFGYNISPSGGCNFKDGMASEETRKKQSEAGLKRLPPSKETCEKLSKALIGRIRNPEDAEKAWKTKKESGTYAPWNKKKKDCYSEETIQKFKLIAKNRIITEERKMNTRNSLKDKPLKVNTIQKECEYCGIITNPGNYGKWHGDKCKRK